MFLNMPRSRPRTDDQTVEVVCAAMLGKKAPDFCPVCGAAGLESLEEQHPYGEGFVTEFLGLECGNCGRLYCCTVCRGWHSERWDNEEPPEDYKPYLCECPPPSPSACSPGTLEPDVGCG